MNENPLGKPIISIAVVNGSRTKQLTFFTVTRKLRNSKMSFDTSKGSRSVIKLSKKRVADTKMGI